MQEGAVPLDLKRPLHCLHTLERERDQVQGGLICYHSAGEFLKNRI